MKHVEVTIGIKSENGNFTQLLGGAIPVKHDKAGSFNVDFELIDEGLIRVLTNAGAVFLKSQEENNNFVDLAQKHLRQNRDKVLSNNKQARELLDLLIFVESTKDKEEKLKNDELDGESAMLFHLKKLKELI